MPTSSVQEARTSSEAFAVRGLGVGYRTEMGVVPMVANVDLDVQPGTILGVAGESGSGKTTAVLAAIGYQASAAVRLAGESRLGETAIFELNAQQRRRLWSQRVSYVAQEAAGALNPAFRIGTQVVEVLEAGLGLDRTQARERAQDLLAAVRLPDAEEMMRRYPHQCSGGQLQRVAIAMAIASDPALIVCDEPTTGLDVTTQAEVVQMLTDLIRARNMAAIYISHDLALLGAVADRLAVFYAGEIVELGKTSDVLAEPRHPYTRALLAALPSARMATTPQGLPGFPPGRVVPESCAFAPRCAYAIGICQESHPKILPIADEPGRLVQCWRSEEDLTGPAFSPHVKSDAPDEAAILAPLLSLRDVWCSYGKGQQRVAAVRGVSLEIGPGEVMALVGESGSGKSTIGRAIVGLLPVEQGEIVFAGARLASNGKRTSAQAKAIQIIFQNPDLSLNPRHTVGALIGRSLELFRPEVARNERQDAIAAAMGEVRLDPAMASRYPHQLSGGQKQRVAIARAFVAQPRLVICDEVVSGQDVSVQASILELVRAMQERHGTALLFIAHDLAVVRSIAQRVAVIQQGQIMEAGPTEVIFIDPRAEYSQRLLGSVLEPVLSGEAGMAL